MTTTTVKVETLSGPLRKPQVPSRLPTRPEDLLKDFQQPFTLESSGIWFKTPLDVFKYTGPDQKKYQELALRLKEQENKAFVRYTQQLAEWDSQVRGPISHYLSFEAQNASAGSSFTVRSADTLSQLRVTIEQVASDSHSAISIQ